MRSLTHRLAFVLLAMSVAPLILGISALYALRTAGSALNRNDHALQSLSRLLDSAGATLRENAALQKNAHDVGVNVNTAQAETSEALKKMGDTVLPKSLDISSIRFALGNMSAAERALLLALNMRHLNEDELAAIRAMQIGIMEEAARQIDQAIDDYQTRLDSPAETQAWHEFEKALDDWEKNHNDFMSEIANLDRLVEDLVRGGPLFASASRKAYDTIFVRGRETRELCEKRIEALNRTLATSTARTLEAAAGLQDRSNALMRDVEKETAEAVTRSSNLGRQIDDARNTALNAADMAAQAMESSESRFRHLVVIAVLCMAAAVIFGIAMARRISHPIKRAAENMTRLAQGEVLGDIPPELLRGKDEIGQLSRSMQELIGSYRHEIGVADSVARGDYTRPIPLRSEMDQLGIKLRAMLSHSNSALGRVHKIVGKVGQGADQVSSASQSLSHGAQTSAAALEEITQSVTHVDQQAKENARNAAEAGRLATASREAAKRGYDTVSDLVSAMMEIQAEGKRIASVAKLIDDIAFQTNLLALNAAVEAARAGRYGKGFSVVADEVRNLSGRSARAAKETGNMVAAMTERMSAGVEMAEKSDHEFRDIVDATSKVANIFDSITDASAVQSQAVAQIARGLEQIDEVIQENTHNAEATAMSAQWLSAQAVELRDSVSQFKLLPDHLAPGDGADEAPRLMAATGAGGRRRRMPELQSAVRAGLLPLSREAAPKGDVLESGDEE